MGAEEQDRVKDAEGVGKSAATSGEGLDHGWEVREPGIMRKGDEVDVTALERDQGPIEFPAEPAEHNEAPDVTAQFAEEQHERHLGGDIGTSAKEWDVDIHPERSRASRGRPLCHE
jgi:hypothetical protein